MRLVDRVYQGCIDTQFAQRRHADRGALCRNER
jgi:hypothetical protein